MRRGTSGINLLLGINKPLGMTSHDVVSRVRKIVGEKRVGHAGTLDPAASGVLIIGIGQGTRLMGQLTQEHKGYLARVSFGCETSTDDAEGEVVHEAPVPTELYDQSYATAVLQKLVGPSMQVPPVYSAISVGGVRSYARARAGEEFSLEARPIEVFDATLVGVEDSLETASNELSWLVSFDVSKGTYIRALARDLGKSVGSAAHLSALTRTFSGSVSLSECLSLEEVEKLESSELIAHALNPLAALAHPVLVLNEAQANDVACGKRMSLARVSHDLNQELSEGAKVSLVFGCKLVGVWKAQGPALVCDTNFPAGIEGCKYD